MSDIFDEKTGIKCSSVSLSFLARFRTDFFNNLSLKNRENAVMLSLYTLAFDNKLSLSGSKISDWEYNGYVSEKEGFNISINDLKASYSFTKSNSEFANYKVLDTILHEFYHRYTTLNRNKQSPEFQINLDGYYDGENILYYTQPTEIGARQFAIRMMEKLNEEFYQDKDLDIFIKRQKNKFLKENRKELIGIVKEGYINNTSNFYDFKARENIIDKYNLEKYVSIKENNINYYLDSYQNTLTTCVTEDNLNSEKGKALLVTCKNDTLFINNFYCNEKEFTDYTHSFLSLEEKAEQIAKFYEKQTGKEIKKLVISPFLQGLSKNARNKVVKDFLSRKNNINKSSFFNIQDFNIEINNENNILENKILTNNNDIKFASILNRLENTKEIDKNSFNFLKEKLINEYGFDEDIENEEIRKMFKYFSFKTNSIEERLNPDKLADCINDYFVLKSSNKLDEEISENIIEDKEKLKEFLNKELEKKDNIDR